MSILPIDLIPTQKMERWKYTPLSRVLKSLDLREGALGWGRDVEPLSMAAPGAALYGDTQLWDLNAKQTKDIKFIQGDADIHFTPADGQWVSPRLVIAIKDGTECTITETHAGMGSFWNNLVVQITIGKNAVLHHYRHFDLPYNAVCTSFTHIKQARDSRYHAFYLTEGQGMIRNQIHAEIADQNALCDLTGVTLLSGKQHADTTITIEHQAPHCQSNQLFKSVLAGQSHGVFQGKVHVHQAAQKTDGYQLSNALILSEGAEMDTKPELEIYADDVKCSHGATTGKLDDQPLFYLQSRGIPKKEARRLLIEAFCGEALENIKRDSIKAQYTERVSAWLNHTV